MIKLRKTTNLPGVYSNTFTSHNIMQLLCYYTCIYLKVGHQWGISCADRNKGMKKSLKSLTPNLLYF